MQSNHIIIGKNKFILLKSSYMQMIQLKDSQGETN